LVVIDFNCKMEPMLKNAVWVKVEEEAKKALEEHAG
jgi:hypothetical protein